MSDAFTVTRWMAEIDRLQSLLEETVRERDHWIEIARTSGAAARAQIEELEARVRSLEEALS